MAASDEDQLPAGSLTEWVTLIKEQVTTDNTGLGETDITHQKVWSFRASVKEEDGRELISNYSATAVSRYTIKCRYRDDVSEKSLIEWDGKKLNVSRVSVIGRKKGLKILATEVR